MNDKVPFREMFSCCREDEALFSLLDKANVLGVSVDKKTASMQVRIEFPDMPAPVLLGLIEEGIADELELPKVTVQAFLSP